MAGTVECVGFTEKVYQTGKTRAENGKGFLDEENIRLAWFSTKVDHDPKVIDWLQEKFGCNVLYTMTEVFPGPIEDLSSMRKIYEGLARQLVEMPMTRECGGIAEDWIEYAIPICKEYKLDVVFLTLNLGCKNAWALAKLLKDAIMDQTGIPTLVLEVDLVDERTISGASIRDAIKNFLATMLG